MIICLFVVSSLFADDNSPTVTSASSFSLYHLVNEDPSLEFMFLNPQGNHIAKEEIIFGENNIGGLYAIYNTNRTASLHLSWTPLLLKGAESASSDNTYPFSMILKNSSGIELESYPSREAGAAVTSEFYVEGAYDSGVAYFINKPLTKNSDAAFVRSLICAIYISIEEKNLPSGQYCSTLTCVVEGD